MTTYSNQTTVLTGCIDLHTHSTASDGLDTPSALVKKAADLGLSVIALTDHDTVYGVKEALAEAAELRKSGIDFHVIPGCEFSVSFYNRDIHMLGLYIDTTYKPLLTLLETAAESRDQRNRTMLSRFQKDGFDVRMEDLLSFSTETKITRAHFARVLVEKGYAKDFPDAFTRFLGDDSYYYVKREFLDPETVIHTIHDAGGIACLAHPLQYKLSSDRLIRMIETFADFGLDAMEARYSSYDREDEMYLRSICRRYSLKVSGGSDYHGAVKPGLSLGSGYGNGWCIQKEDVTVLKK